MGELIALGFGGTSGPLYGTFLSQGSLKLQELFEENNRNDFFMALIMGTEAVK